MTDRTFLRGGTVPAALGSLVSLATQALMALFLLKLFEPQAVGVFSVIAQLAFGWSTLALAQSPVSLLANQHLSALPAARQAWQASLRRWGWLAPVALLAAVWASGGTSPWLSTMLWAAAIALVQMGWLLAQSLSLRIHAPLSIAGVRMLPPVLAAALAAAGALWMDWRSSHLLSAAALIGYAAGALWLLPVLRAPSTPVTPATAMQGDLRSDRLKFIHTLSDVAVATMLAAHWASVYGSAQAGCLLILLRVTGFIPALVSTAWAQVVLSRPQAQRPGSWLAALAGATGVAMVCLVAGLALQAGWLSAAWAPLADYLWPVALWQIGACLVAAVSHRPFQHGRSVIYTRQCLGINAVQALLLLLPPWLGWGLHSQLWALAGFLGLSLSLQALWAAGLRDRAPPSPSQRNPA